MTVYHILEQMIVDNNKHFEFVSKQDDTIKFKARTENETQLITDFQNLKHHGEDFKLVNDGMCWYLKNI